MRKALTVIMLFYCVTVFSGAIEKIVLDVGTYTYRENGLFFNIPIVGDLEKALKVWYEPEISAPGYEIIREYKRGEIAIPFIMYRTEALKEGEANITYSFKTIRSDGSVSSHLENMTVVKGAPPEGIGKVEQLVAYRVEKDDPFGKYTMVIEITDHNANRMVCFNLEFEVVE